MIARYVTNTYEITDTYKEIRLDAKDAKVKIQPANDDCTKLDFFEKKRRSYEWFLQDGALTIQSTKRRWYHLFRIGIDHSELRICVPKSMLETLSVTSNVGHVEICSIVCNGTIDLRINTGNINLENVSCKDFDSKGNAGSVLLNDVAAKEAISVKRNTGKVLLNDCSAPEIFVQTNTGRVCGRLPSNTVFVVRTNTGKIDIPKAPIGETIGGRCEIKTNTGNVKFESVATDFIC